MGWRWLAALALLTATGCLSAPPDEISSDGGSGDDADADADADVDADAGPPTDCGHPGLLRSNFNGGVSGNDFTRYDEFGASAAGAESAAVVTLGDQGNAYGGFATYRSYDLRGGAASITVKEMVDTDTDAQVFFSGLVATNYGIEFKQENGRLYFQYDSSGKVDLGSIDYDSTDHAVWRLREQGGTIYWETAQSTDGPFTVQHEEEGPIDLDWMRFHVNAQANGSTSAGRAVFDDYNLAEPAETTWCPAADTKSDFNTGLPAYWTEVDTGANCSVLTDGEVIVTLGAATTCGVALRPLVDMTGSSAAVKVTGVPAAGEGWAHLRLAIDDLNYAEIRADALTIQAVISVSGVEQVFTQPYGGEAFWRIRDSGTTFDFEVFDGNGWSKVANETVSFDRDALEVHLRATATAPFDSVETASFDEYNLAPE